LKEASKNKGNLVAVGSFEAGIEIWDLDVVGTLEPVVVLGGEETKKKKSKKVR
jgi:periodic tryptophan protein 1